MIQIRDFQGDIVTGLSLNNLKKSGHCRISESVFYNCLFVYIKYVK